jgi:hypothetical protein
VLVGRGKVGLPVGEQAEWGRGMTGSGANGSLVSIHYHSRGDLLELNN